MSWRTEPLKPSKATEVSFEDAQWLAEIEAESIGWQPLGDGAYLHVGKHDEGETIITVTGVPDASMAGMNVLLVG